MLDQEIDVWWAMAACYKPSGDLGGRHVGYEHHKEYGIAMARRLAILGKGIVNKYSYLYLSPMRVGARQVAEKLNPFCLALRVEHPALLVNPFCHAAISP